LQRAPQHGTAIEASLVWFDTQRLETDRPYLFKHGTSTRSVRITRVVERKNIQTLVAEAVSSLGMNDIGLVELELTLPLFFDPYVENRSSGSFILIDPQSNATVAAGMIRRALSEHSRQQSNGAVFFVAEVEANILDLELRLIATGAQVVRTRIQNADTIRSLFRLGLVVLVNGAPSTETIQALADAGIVPGDATSYLHGTGDLHD
jgi:hypothetical protein